MYNQNRSIDVSTEMHFHCANRSFLKVRVSFTSTTVALPQAFVYARHTHTRNSYFIANTAQKQHDVCMWWVLSTRLQLGQLGFKNQPITHRQHDMRTACVWQLLACDQINSTLEINVYSHRRNRRNRTLITDTSLIPFFHMVWCRSVNP